MNLGQASDPSASNADRHGVSESSGGIMVARGSRIWTELPADVVGLILRALSPSAYCRLRCVCKAFNRLASSSPDLTYWTRTGTPCMVVLSAFSDVHILCPPDEHFLTLPHMAALFSKLNRAMPGSIDERWCLVDVDEGLLCYVLPGATGSHFALCDPFTLAYRILSPTKTWNFDVKLLVDRDNRTYKIVLADWELEETRVFDSTTSRWNRFRFSYPSMTDKLFAWKGVVYAYRNWTTNRGLCALDIGSGAWNEVQMQLPGDDKYRSQHILSDNHEVILVRSSSDGTSVAAWKLRHDGASQGPDFSLHMWEELHIGRLGIPNEKGLQFDEVCGGSGYICATFMGVRQQKTPSSTGTYLEGICVVYSFVTGRSFVIPLHVGGIWDMFPWEPNVDEFRF